MRDELLDNHEIFCDMQNCYVYYKMFVWIDYWDTYL